MPIPGNQSTTIIEISWDSVEINTAHIDSFLLYENNTVVADLHAVNSYSFSSNGSIHKFQIISQTLSKK
jgi:hypothetical protein